MLVYLGGPITGQTYDGATDWRTLFAESVDDRATCLNPMRGKSYLKGQGEISCAIDEYKNYQLSCGRGIYTRDRFDCMRSDVVVMNFIGANRVSIGSVLEIGWADSRRIPIIAIMDKGNVHEHSMLEQAFGWVVPCLSDAIYIVNALLPEKQLVTTL